MRYVGGERAPGCIFCHAAGHPDDRDTLVIQSGEQAFVLLNRFPYNSGHLMVVPKAHVPSIEDVDSDTRAEMFELVNTAITVCRPVFRCDGFNVGMNIGQVAGAGIADHLHMHLVPRWTGDANFMPILSDTMVLPETLDATYARLRAEWQTMEARAEGDMELAAGALVYLTDRRKFVLRKAGDAPAVIAKGKIEPGETAAEAAVREITEETNIDATLVGWLGSQVIQPPEGSGRHPQHAVFFLAIAESADAINTDDTLVVSPDELMSSIDIPELRDVISAAWPAIEHLTGQQT